MSQQVAPGFDVFGSARGRSAKDAQEIWDETLLRLERDRLDLYGWLRSSRTALSFVAGGGLSGSWSVALVYLRICLRAWQAPGALNQDYSRIQLTYAELAGRFPEAQRQLVHTVSQTLLAYHFAPLIGRAPVRMSGEDVVFDRRELAKVLRPLIRHAPMCEDFTPFPDSLTAIYEACLSEDPNRSAANIITASAAVSERAVLNLSAAN